jgi:hypothetical protein
MTLMKRSTGTTSQFDPSTSASAAYHAAAPSQAAGEHLALADGDAAQYGDCRAESDGQLFEGADAVDDSWFAPSDDKGADAVDDSWFAPSDDEGADAVDDGWFAPSDDEGADAVYNEADYGACEEFDSLRL